MVAGSLGGFVLAMMVITGFEWASGETLSGQEGTTIGRAANDPAGPPKPRSPACIAQLGQTDVRGPRDHYHQPERWCQRFAEPIHNLRHTDA